MEHENDVYTNYNWCSWYSYQMIIKGTGGLGNKRTSRDHPNYYIIKNGQNTEKNTGDLKLDLARESKKLWNMNVTIIPIIVGALSTVTKRLVHGLEDLEITGRVEIIQTTKLLRSARILRRVREICCPLKNAWEKPLVNADVTNSLGVK